MIPTLTSDRLTLAGPNDAWRTAFAVFAQSDRAQWFTNLREPGGDWHMLALGLGHWALEGYGPFCLFERDTKTPVGMFGIWHPRGWREDPGLFWLLFEGAEGKGYIPEAARAAARWQLDNGPVRKATSHVDQRNTRSIATAERLNGQFVCTFDKPEGPHNRYLHGIEEMAA